MNELKNLVERLKRYKAQSEGKENFPNFNVELHDALLLLPILESHLQQHRTYTHAEKIAMVRNREASVLHDDREAIERAMKGCFPNDMAIQHYKGSFYFASNRVMKNINWCQRTHNPCPHFFLASNFSNESKAGE